MNEQNYQRNVLSRASTEWHGEKAILSHLRGDLYAFWETSESLDAMKKAIFYGRGDQSYHDKASCKALPDHINPDLFHALLGVLTEAGEIAMALLKALPKGYYMAPGEPIDAVNIQEELGDVNWYRVLALHHLGQTEAENRAQNEAKLEKRFGPVLSDLNVFTAERANNRDLETERATLETTATAALPNNWGEDQATDAALTREAEANELFARTYGDSDGTDGA